MADLDRGRRRSRCRADHRRVSRESFGPRLRRSDRVSSHVGQGRRYGGCSQHGCTGIGSGHLGVYPRDGWRLCARVPELPLDRRTGRLRTSSNWTVRGLFGPAWVRADDSTYGFQGRVDMAVPLISRLWFIVSARGLIVPSYRGDRFRLYAFSGGLRIR